MSWLSAAVHADLPRTNAFDGRPFQAAFGVKAGPSVVIGHVFARISTPRGIQLGTHIRAKLLMHVDGLCWLVSVLLLLIAPHRADALRRPFLSDVPSHTSQPAQLAVTSSLMDAILPAQSNTAAAAKQRQLQHNEEEACQQHLLKTQAVGPNLITCVGAAGVQAVADPNVPLLQVRDRSALSTVFLNRNIELALHARRASDWAASVPWPIFLSYVLPYARWASLSTGPLRDALPCSDALSVCSLTERREGWRRLFFQELLPQVPTCSSCRQSGYRSMALASKTGEP